jgi:hypothetical protein
MKNMERVIFGSILLIGLGFSLQTQACTTTGWVDSFNIPDNGVAGSPTAVSRYSELCALAVTGQSYVQSNKASDTQYIGRFYVFPDVSGSGEVDLLVAYAEDTATTPLFRIAYDGSNFIFDAGGAGGGSNTTTLAASGWNLVEFEFNSDGNFNFWVNETWDFNALSYSSGPTGTFAAGSGTVEAVRLGAPNGMASQAGTISYDAYEAHRTSQVGALLAGDANKDGDVNTGDIGTVITEFFGADLAPGTPDCNKDGEVNTGDIGCIITIFFTTP